MTLRRTRRRVRRPRRVVGLVVAACTVLVLPACTDDEEPPEPGREDAALELTVGPGAAGLTPTARDQLQTDVGDVLTAYVVSAFLGDYPRDDFIESLDNFTAGVAQRAARDLDMLTGASVGDADDVVATGLNTRISTFAPESEALAVSATVDFAFEVLDGDEPTGELHLTGRMLLRPEGEQWRIFGYDVELDSAAPQDGAP